MRKRVFIVLLAMGVAAVLSAQTKFSAKEKCGKADPDYGVPVGDQAGHVMMLSHVKCAWSEGEIAGAKMEISEDTFTGEVHDGTSSDRGYAVVDVAGGDKAFVRFEGKTSLKDQKPVDGKGTWSFIGGTGKLKAIKGKGTYQGKYDAEGVGSFDIEGEYTLPAAKAAKPAK